MTQLYRAVIIMSLFSLITNLFSGCKNKEPDAMATPAALPEGVRLTEMYISHQGMAREPYYVLLTTDEGMLVCAVYDTPVIEVDSETQLKRLNSEAILNADETFGEAKKVDDEVVHELEDAIEKSGALGWDGWNKSKSLSAGVLDGDNSYSLFLRLSNGNTVTMSGYNTKPQGWDELYSKSYDIFQTLLFEE